MKHFRSKKIIVLLLIVVTLFNFILPTVSEAKSRVVDEIAGGLYLGVCKLLRHVGDLLLEYLQETFIGEEFYTGAIDTFYVHNDSRRIKYSPGVIFSGKVPALDVNFFNPGSEKNLEVKKKKQIVHAYSYDYNSVAELALPQILIKLGYKEVENTLRETLDKILADISFDIGSDDNSYVVTGSGELSKYPINGVTYILGEYPSGTYSFEFYKEGKRDGEMLYQTYTFDDQEALTQKKQEFEVDFIEKFGVNTSNEDNKKREEAEKELKALFDEKNAIFSDGQTVSFDFRGTTIFINYDTHRGDMYGSSNWLVYTEEEIEETETTIIKESSAKTLQPIVATWYKALRAIALVGLLSVLVYIGIRILISSTSQEKAKYKKMIGDWLAAICLLFVLQYIMIFILEISDGITKILSKKVVQPDGTDILITTIRDKLDGEDEIFTKVFPELVIYLVLIVHTIIFTFQYLKRLLYMAFFTMIAPLIALTYPLDKIKDGQAQAFSIWLREYIFNALLQPMHLLLYYIFVTTAYDLIGENWIFSIVAIGFLVPAEKFFRKMFGFEKAQSSGQLGAAAGGALAMNAINSLKKIGKSSGSKNSEKNETSEKNSSGSGGGSKSTPRYIRGPGEGKTGGSSAGGGQGLKTVKANKGTGATGKESTVFGQPVKRAGTKGTMSLKNGAKTLAGHYINKNNAKKLGKGLLKGAIKGTAGLAGAATLGTLGLAIGTATGDASKALGFGAAGLGAGFSAGSNLASRGIDFEKKNREIFKEGAVGTEEYNIRSSAKELTNDNDFNRTCKYLEIESPEQKEELIRQFHKNGIKDSEDIKKVMNIRARLGVSQDQVIAAYKIKKEADKNGLRRDNIEKRLKRQGIGKDDVKQAMDIIDML